MIGPLYLLSEAATELGVTPNDVANPARWVRDQLRKYKIPFVRHGRTVKLTQDQLQALADRLTKYPANSSAMETVPAVSATLRLVDDIIASASIAQRKRARSATSTTSIGKRLRSEIPKVENPLARSKRRLTPK